MRVSAARARKTAAQIPAAHWRLRVHSMYRSMPSAVNIMAAMSGMTVPAMPSAAGAEAVSSPAACCAHGLSPRRRARATVATMAIAK